MPPNDGTRPRLIGPDAGPEPPFPLRMKGEVVKGFGRGSKELGIPTANISLHSVPWIETADSGVYFGWAGIQLPPAAADNKTTGLDASLQKALPAAAHEAGWRLFPMVMSIGFNPFYKNTVRSAEVHVMHNFVTDFYGAPMAIAILGYIRPEYDYVSKESLIEDINEDIEVARRSLARDAYRERCLDGYLWGGES